MHAGQARILGTSYIGLFAFANDSFVLLPKSIPQKTEDYFSEILKVRAIKVSISSSDLIGIFAAGNSNGIILPNLSYSDEIAELKKNGINVHVINEERTALGNNILVNDKAAVINPKIKHEEAKKIGDFLNVEVIQENISGLSTPGAICVVTNKGLLAYNNIKESELRELESLFKVKGSVGTANLGMPFVRLCVIANSNGFIAGEETSGFEMSRIDEALNFI